MTPSTESAAIATPHRPERTEQGLRLPDFMIVGAAKCGTTTLYQYLQRRPEVFMSTPKEMSFFSKPEVHARGLAWYAALFEDARDDQLCGEASTTYSRWPTYEGTIDRIVGAVPNVKLLYILRNPVDRLYSFYAHRMRHRVTAPIDRFLEETPEAIHSGLYHSQIAEIERRVPRERLMVLLLEDLKRDTESVLQRVGDFLGLPPFDYHTDGAIVANPGSGHYAATRSLTSILQGVRRTPVLGQATQMLPRNLRDKGFRWLQSGPVGRALRSRHTRQMPALTPALRRELYRHFATDIERLEGYLERDLSMWKENDQAGTSE